MTVRWLLAWAHLLGLGIGLGAVWARGRALREPLDAAGLRRVFAWDNWWGAAAGIWIVTGSLRAFGQLEKGTDFYLHNGWFLLKMALLAAILVLEIRPMTTLLRWRIASRKAAQVDTARAPALARVSDIQAVLVVLMALCATAMARALPLP
jgi:putative membrane protein